MQKKQVKKKATGNRRGTAVQSKGQQTAQDIIAAARAVLAEKGHSSLTTQKVANRLGIRQSNVQYYYPTKIDLVQALFQSTIDTHMMALADRMASGKLSPKRRLLWSLDFILNTHESLEQIAFMREMWALANHDADVARLMDGFYRQWIDIATENLLEFNPELGKRRAQRRALAIISLVDGLSLFHGAAALDHPAVVGIEKEVRRIVLQLASEV